MYVFLLFLLSCLMGWLIWRKLFMTSLRPYLRSILTSLSIIIIFVVLFWISVGLSIINV